MNQRSVTQLVCIATVLALMMFTENCSRIGTSASYSSGSANSSSQGVKGGANYDGGTTTDNPKATVKVIVTSSGDPVQLGGTQLCLGEISFYSPNPTRVPSPRDLDLGDSPNSFSVGMSSILSSQQALINMVMAQFQYTESLMGTNLALMNGPNPIGSIPLTPGSYSRVDLVLEQSCSYGSFSVPTSAGKLNEPNPVTLHFVGSLDLAGQETVILDLKNILNALAAARSSPEALAILATTPGTF